MARKKIEFPVKGRIKLTGSPVDIIGETTEAGIACYLVVFAGDDPRRAVSWAKSKVVVGRDDH